MESLVKISKYAGMREDIVQAGGGNTSVKLGNNRMAIKASGVQLADLTLNDGYAIVNTKMIIDYLKSLVNGNLQCDEKTILEQAQEEGMKPSIETFLHSITEKYTLHSHSTVANILLAQNNGVHILQDLFPDALFVDYATPGLELAKLYYKTYCERGQQRFSIAFLRNHGLIVSAATSDKVIELHENVLYTIENYLGIDAKSYHNTTKIYQTLEQLDLMELDIIYKVENKVILDAFEKYQYQMWPYQFCPDCIVYCGKCVWEFNDFVNMEKVKDLTVKYGTPVIIICEKNIYIKASSIKKAKEIESVLAFSAKVAECAGKNNLSLLTEHEQFFLLNWDAEVYRKQLK